MTLQFDPASGRFRIGTHELHCGDCFKIKVNAGWHEVRIEHSGRDGWYLIGLPRGTANSADFYTGNEVQL